MKRKIIFTLIALAVLVVVSLKWMLNAGLHELEVTDLQWKNLAELDRTFLTNVVTRPSALVSGTYICETRFPGQPVKIDVLSLTFTNGQFPPPDAFHQPLPGAWNPGIRYQTNNIVFWQTEGGPSYSVARWVGVIDGDRIWGRVYGWNPGAESIGNWLIYPQTEPAKP